MKKNQFLHRINKDAVNSLPLARFHGEVIVVRDKEAAIKALDYLNRQTVVGVDTETKPSFVRGEHHPTALVQIATIERCYLFQLKFVAFDAAMAALFANPDICKVGLAFRDDLRGLQRLCPFRPANCVDLQQIVLKYGILDLGLQKMFAIVFGYKISKSQQLTNWEVSVLTDEQAYYAATDAWATLLIYKELLQTSPLPKKVYMALRDADLQRQLEHQQQVMAERMAAADNNNTKI